MYFVNWAEENVDHVIVQLAAPNFRPSSIEIEYKFIFLLDLTMYCFRSNSSPKAINCNFFITACMAATNGGTVEQNFTVLSVSTYAWWPFQASGAISLLPFSPSMQSKPTIQQI